METIDDVMNFLNQMEMFKIEYGIDYSLFKSIRKILIEEFEDVDLDKLVGVLGNLDDLYIEYLKMKDCFDMSLIITLREKIFDMWEQKRIKNSR